MFSTMTFIGFPDTEKKEEEKKKKQYGKKKIPLTILGSYGKLPLLVASSDGVGNGRVGTNVQTGSPHPGHHSVHLGSFTDGSVIAGSLKRWGVVIDVENHHSQHGGSRQLGGNLKPQSLV